jgi:hypothetical protein
MSIYNALVANKKNNVLCEYAQNSLNVQQFSRQLLTKAIESETTQALDFHNHRFHSINQNGLTFLCLSANMTDDIVLSFLRDVQSSLLRQYDYEFLISAPAYKCSAFEKQIKELVEYYENRPRQSITGEIIKDLSEVKKMVVKNITTLMDRENTLDLAIDNSSKLKHSALKVHNFVRILFLFIIFFICLVYWS